MANGLRRAVAGDAAGVTTLSVDEEESSSVVGGARDEVLNSAWSICWIVERYAE